VNPEISIDRSRLDRDFIVRSVQGSYWGGGYTPEQILGALDASIVVGAYDGPTQIGFVRVVSDGHIFSSITDVFVEEARRGSGVGSAMMDFTVRLPEVARTMCILQARPLAQFWYMRWHFAVIDRGSGIMQRMPG
jgi:GNAT superfamily N-acetyltransferase